MKTLVALLREMIVAELQRQGAAGLIVWYDPGRTLADLVERALPPGVRLLRFEGSYLALRLALEGEDPLFRSRWVVYIPVVPPPESWLRDWELLGIRWEVDLLVLLRQQAGLAVTPALAALLRDHPDNARALVARWADKPLDGRPLSERTVLDELLAVGCGLAAWREESAVLRFLVGEVSQAALAARGLWSLFCARLAEWTGCADLPAEETALRERLEAMVLLTELAEATPDLAAQVAGVLPPPSRRSAVAALAREWRERESWRAHYRQAARRVQASYELDRCLMVSAALQTVETVPVIDDLWRRKVWRTLAPDASNLSAVAPRLLALAEQRARLFWAREGAASWWQPMAVALRLFQGCQVALTQIEPLTRVADLVARYTKPDGWWRLDAWALELAVLADRLNEEERARLAYPAWRAYGEYLDRVNRRLAQAVRQEGWAPDQQYFWSQHVGTRPTVIFLIDALRYDLAQRLASRLRLAGTADRIDVRIRALRGHLPSVTDVGMSALLPQAEHGLALRVERDQIRVTLQNQEVGGRARREAWLREHLGTRGALITLDQVSREVPKLERLVVLSREIDTLGTFAAEIHPASLLDIVERLAQAVLTLRDQGYERFVISADHGFLFLPPGVEPRSLPTPAATIGKRRFVIGGVGEGCLVVQATEVGLKGEAVLAFPSGLAVFSVPGETGAFLHGGLSLQECIVPVVEIEAPVTLPKVPVVLQAPDRLTSRVAVLRVRAGSTSQLARPRRVQVEINGRRSPVVEVSLTTGEQTVSLPWLDFESPPPAQVCIRLFDADGQQVLQEISVPVEIGV